ncbi:MAG: GAF domain-containing protein [Armatimonadota bacterium]|nr:GAF domain-containing protein [Armatimonadota bacterium]
MDAITRLSGDSLIESQCTGALSSLRRLSQLISSDQSPDTALDYAAEAATVLLNADKAAIYLVRKAGDDLTLSAAFKLTKRALAAKKPRLGEPIARRCIADSIPLAIKDVSADEDARPLAREGAASALCAPITDGEKTVGAILVLTRKPRDFSAADVEMLQMVADQVAPSALRALGAASRRVATPHVDAHLIEFANRKIRDLTMLNQVSAAITGALDLDQLLDIVLKQAMLAVGAGVGSLLLIDESTKTMSIRAAKGLSPEIAGKTRVRVGEGISGWVATHGMPILVHNARKDDRFRGIAFRDDITSAMSVPLKTKSKVIGVLNLSTVERDHLFNEQDLELLGTLANQMAMAIESARLLAAVQTRNNELSILLELAGAVGATLELDEVLDVLLQQICGLTDVRICCILIYSEQTGKYRLGGFRGPDDITKAQYLDLSIPAAKRAAETGRPAYTSDLAGYVDLAPEFAELVRRHKLRGMLSLPLKVKDSTVGAVVAFSERADAFTGSDMSLLTGVGDLAGVAVQNARVYRRQYRMAQLLQNDLMPKAHLGAPGIEVGQVYSPAREVGGDYFDFVGVGRDKIGLVVADVTGCSIPAAAYISMGKHVLRAYARDNASPANVLTRVNRVVYEDTPSDMFISMFYGIFDLKAQVLRYGMAGHEPPILYRPSTGKFRLLEAPGILIGILGESDFSERKVSLRPGDIITFYTDGLSGAVVNHKEFGREPIREEMRKHALKPSQEIADNIHARLLAFAEGSVSDDVAIVTIKIL